VNVPSLNSTADTTLYLYFGNVVSPNQANPALVWDADFKAVWHLKENPAASAPQIRDSTSNGNHGTANGTMVASDQSPGIVGGSLTFDGKTKFINIPDSATLDSSTAVTVSTWIRTTSGSGDINVVSKGVGCITSGFVMWLNENRKGTSMPSFWVGNSGWVDARGVNIADGRWHYLVATNDASTTNIYVDGVLQGSGPRSGVLDTASTLRMAYGDCGTYLAGSLDEVRLSGSARAAAWIATEFANESAPQAFAIVAATQTGPH
jgi:hypothetical protein